MTNNFCENSFCGKLQLWGFNCFFIYSECVYLSIRPFPDVEEAFNEKCKQGKSVFDDLGWLFGTKDGEYDVAFFVSPQQGEPCYYKGELTLTVDIFLGTYNFHSPDGNYLYDYKDLRGFNAIDFAGKAVDSIFPSKAAINKTESGEYSIAWVPSSELSREFDTKIEGQTCKLIFTYFVERQDFCRENDSLGIIKSILRLEFEERQDLSILEKCWEAVCRFLTFCIGQFNVTNLLVGLWDEKNNEVGKSDSFGLISCKLNCMEEEDIVPRHPSYYRFQIESLGDKTGELFRTLNDVEKRPILGFLPRSNDDISIDRNKIRELCTAFEVEYNFCKEDISDPPIAELVKQLLETVKAYKEDNPEVLDDNEYSYINSSISYISKPARKKIVRIYTKYKDIIDEYLQCIMPFVVDRMPDTSDKTTEDDIGKIVKIRNNITHSKTVMNVEIPHMIYQRLRIALFCSILERSGYDRSEIKTIIIEYVRGRA